MTIYAYVIVLIASILVPGQALADGPVYDTSMGSADAPVTMIEYASLSCPHCAKFHEETLPKIKKEYIDTGKVRFIYRDFPFGSLAMAGAMVARCSGPEKFFGMIDILFRSQKDWVNNGNPLVNLKRIAKFGGMSGKDVDKCLREDALLVAIQKRQLEAENKYGVNSTPTFLIDGIKMEGARPFEDFKAAIDKALKKHK